MGFVLGCMFGESSRGGLSEEVLSWIYLARQIYYSLKMETPVAIN